MTSDFFPLLDDRMGREPTIRSPHSALSTQHSAPSTFHSSLVTHHSLLITYHLLNYAKSPMRSSDSIDLKPFISLHHISKRFGSLRANHDISMDFHEGEIHAIIGENGAGKSTLMKILNGHLQPDSGEIRLQGNRVSFSRPRDSMLQGIGMAYQQLLIFPQLSALENVIVGVEPGAGGWLKRNQAKNELMTLCQSVGFDLPLDAPAAELSFAHRQQIEILRLLYRKVKVLILDEPTSLLAPPETERFLGLLQSLQAGGHTIIFVSHRLREVLAIADRVSVLSRGKLIGSYPLSDINAERLIELVMSGGAPRSPRVVPSDDRASQNQNNSQAINHPQQSFTSDTDRAHGLHLELNDIKTRTISLEARLEGLSLKICRGEIFGLGGVVGNGQRTLALLLSGMLTAEHGTAFLAGEEITHLPIGKRAELGLRWLPANPLEEALLPSRSIRENLFLGNQRQQSFQHYGWLDQDRIKRWTTELLLQNEIVYGDLADSATSLSGGNLQKLALSRILNGAPSFVILEQPARGLDIRAQEKLRNRVRELNAEGVTFLLISYDLDELLALSHRIGILYRGRMMGIVDRDKASVELLGRWMLGVEDGG